MSYIDDFLKDDDEDTPYWERGDTLASPDSMGGPGDSFEEDISNQLGGSPAPGGNLPDYMPADDAAFKQFIGETADSSPLEPQMDSMDQAKAAAAAGSGFDQQAIADMRASVMGRDTGFNTDDGIFAAIAGALDLGLNKGRGLGQIAGGIGAGLMNREQQKQNSVQDLGQLSIQGAKEARATKESQSREDYYQHSRENQDAQLDLQRQSAQQRAPVQSAQAQEAMAQAELLRAQTAGYAANGGLNPGQVAARDRDDRDYKHQLEREGVADKEHAIDNARQDAPAKAKAAALAAAIASVPEGYEVADEDRWKKSNADDVFMRKLNDAAKGGTSALGSAATLAELRGKGAMLPFRDDERIGQYDLARRSTFGNLSPFTALGTLQKSDIDLLEPIYPESLNIKDAAQLVGQDPNSDRLKGANTELRAMIDRGIGIGGLRLKGAPAAQPNATAGRVGKDPAMAAPNPIDEYLGSDQYQQSMGPGPMQLEQPAPTPINSNPMRGGGGTVNGGGAIATDNGDGTVTITMGTRSQTVSKDDPRLKTAKVTFR